MSVPIVAAPVEEEEDDEAVRDLFFLRSASGFSMKFSGRRKPDIHYLVFIHNRRKHKRLACMSKW
jgi:hypothetical protein